MNEEIKHIEITLEDDIEMMGDLADMGKGEEE